MEKTGDNPGCNRWATGAGVGMGIAAAAEAAADTAAAAAAAAAMWETLGIVSVMEVVAAMLVEG